VVCFELPFFAVRAIIDRWCLMIVGKAFKRRGQRYECTGRSGHWIPARFVWLYDIRTECYDCGRPFTATASRSRIRNMPLPQRCEGCRTGKPIDPIATREARKVARGAARRRRQRDRERARGARGRTELRLPQRAVAQPAATASREETVPAAYLDFLDRILG
jgi:hypothetical protein